MEEGQKGWESPIDIWMKEYLINWGKPLVENNYFLKQLNLNKTIDTKGGHKAFIKKLNLALWYNINLKMDNKYIIITPFKNEEENIEDTIKSIIAQSIKPVSWILIDDGSNNSLNIVNRYKEIFLDSSRKNDSYINDKGARIAAMINDFSNHDKIDFCKIDADVSLIIIFLKNMINYMNSNKKLGICSGTLIYNDKIERPVFSDLTRGATNFITINVLKILMVYWKVQDGTQLIISPHNIRWETKVLPIISNIIRLKAFL